MAADLAIGDIVAAIRSKPATYGVRVVGIDGPAGSGKTTLAAALATELPASVVHMDDFVSWTDLERWWPRFDAEVLTPLSRGQDARYQVRDWIRDEFGSAVRGWKNTAATPVVIIEGVTTTRRAAADRLAYTVWVEAPRDERMERGQARDGFTHRDVWLDWMVMEERFFAADGTRARADLRLDTSGPHTPGAGYRTR